jgi:Voltage gated chloride channel
MLQAAAPFPCSYSAGAVSTLIAKRAAAMRVSTPSLAKRLLLCSAPVAGAVFVLEELVRRFDTRITITTLCASGSAIAVARLLLGNGPDFQLEPLPYSGFGTVPIFLVLGALTGLMGVAYNHLHLSRRQSPFTALNS